MGLVTTSCSTCGRTAQFYSKQGRYKCLACGWWEADCWCPPKAQVHDCTHH